MQLFGSLFSAARIRLIRFIPCQSTYLYSGIRSRLVYAYKLVDAGSMISGNGFRTWSILFRDKLICWWSRIVLGLFKVLITPVDSVNEYISLFDTYMWLIDVVCEKIHGIKQFPWKSEINLDNDTSIPTIPCRSISYTLKLKTLNYVGQITGSNLWRLQSRKIWKYFRKNWY